MPVLWTGDARVRRACQLALVSAALACSSLAARAAAQTAAPCVPDTATVVKRLVLGLSTDRELDPAARELATAIAIQVGSFVEPPTRLTIDKLRGPAEWKEVTGTYQSEGLLSIGQLVIALGPNGRVQQVALDPGTGSLEVDRAVLAAVAGADSGGIFPPAEGAPVRRVRLWLLTAATPPPGWATPLFPVSGRTPANATPAVVQSQRPPTYPPALLASRAEGDAYLAFEVDESGQVPEPSIQVLSADHGAFVEPARQSIREARFVAATQGGCPTRSKLRQRVRFRAPAVIVAPPTDSAARDSALADAGRWFKTNLPKVSRAHVLIEVGANIGGTDVASVRTRIVAAKLDRCTLTLDRAFQAEDTGNPTGGSRIRHEVPLGSVEPRSIGVQQQPLAGSTLQVKGNQPWRVVLGLAGGSIRTDSDVLGVRRSTNDSELDLIVSDRAAGLEIATRLQAAVIACR